MNDQQELINEIGKLTYKVVVLKEALEFYASIDKQNWTIGFTPLDEVAKEALLKIEEL